MTALNSPQAAGQVPSTVKVRAFPSAFIRLLGVGAVLLAAACGDSVSPTGASVPPGGGLLPLQPGERIDVHAHIIPDFYNADLIAHGQVLGGGAIPNPVWTPQLAINFMNSYGIDAQVVSISEPGVSYLETAAERVSMARRLNDYMKNSLITTTDTTLTGRFGGIAVLPIADVGVTDIGNAISESSRALTGLGLDGVGLFTSYAGVYLGDPKFDPLLATLNTLNAVVFVHPVTPETSPTTGIPALVLEFPFETTRAITKMLTMGVFKRYPNIRWMFAHAGGTMPFLSYRASLLTLFPPIEQNLANLGLSLDVPSDLAGLYYDTALSPEPPAMQATRKVAPVTHILLGTDWPFSQVVFVIPGNPAPQLAESFDSAELELVERGNAFALFPTLSSHVH